MSVSDRQLEGTTHDPQLGGQHDLIMGKARELVASLEKRYGQAQEQAAQACGSERIDAAFDEVDRLQRELISAIRRVKELEREAGEQRAEAAFSVHTLSPRHEHSARHAHRPKWARTDQLKPPSP